MAVLGGRHSAELGIDVNAGDAEVERWFMAATLFGARIPARVAERAFGVLAAAELVRIGQLRHVPSADLIAMLDAGGYARYDVRTAERLLELCEVIRDRSSGPGTGLTAQFRRLAGQRLVQLALGRALHDPAHPGPQVSPATGELAQRSHRGGLLIRGQLAPRRVMFRLARGLGDENPRTAAGR